MIGELLHSNQFLKVFALSSLALSLYGYWSDLVMATERAYGYHS
jgi:hypothetical protein